MWSTDFQAEACRKRKWMSTAIIYYCLWPLLTQLKSWQLIFNSNGSEEEGSALPRGSEWSYTLVAASTSESDRDDEESLKPQEITWGM